MAEFGFRRRFADVPVGISEAERETVSTDPGAFVQRAIAGGDFLDSGFQSSVDALMAGPFGLRRSIAATVRRNDLLREQARERLALTQQAIVGRQQQANVDRKNADEAEARAFYNNTKGLKPSEMIVNDLFNPLNRQIVSQVKTAAENYGAGVRESSIDEGARRLKIAERVGEDPEVMRARVNAAKTKVLLDEAQAGMALQEIRGTTGDPVSFARVLGNVFTDKEARVALIDRYHGGSDEYKRNFPESMAKLGELASMYASVAADAQGAGLEVSDPTEMARFRQVAAAEMAASETGEIPASLIDDMAQAYSRIQSLGAALQERKAKQAEVLAQMKQIEESIDLSKERIELEDKKAGLAGMEKMANWFGQLFDSELATLRESYVIEAGDEWPNPDAEDVKKLREIKKKRDMWIKRATSVMEGRLNAKHFGAAMDGLRETLPATPGDQAGTPPAEPEIETTSDAIFQ
jgi:hypothetical protein